MFTTHMSRAGVLASVIFLTLVPITTYAGLTWLDCQAFLKRGRIQFADGKVMPRGPYRGLPLSASTPSPALVMLTEGQVNLLPERPPPDTWAVGNFLSVRGAAIALVPQVPPLKVSMMKELEVDGTYHLMIRMIFPRTRPIRFWTQNLDGLLSEPLEIADVVIDFGTHRTVQDEKNTYTALKGLTGRYALQSRMGTTWFKVRKIRKDRRAVTEFEMFLTVEQKVAMMEHFFRRTGEINNGEMYNSITRNCATEFSMMLAGMGLAPDTRAKCALHGAVSWVPSGLLWSLRDRGFIVSEVEREIEVDQADRL